MLLHLAGEGVIFDTLNDSSDADFEKKNTKIA
jgi:hypothetical protein